MLTFFRRIRWNAKYADELASCMSYVHARHFSSLQRGKSIMDGMSADPTVFLWATVRSVSTDGMRIRVDYSVKDKATIEAQGSYQLLHCNDEMTELSHQPRD